MQQVHKLLITGGHVTPALAVIDRIRKVQKNTDILFVGRKYTSDKEKLTESFEYKEVTSRKIPFIHLSTGRLTRIASLASLKQLMKLPSGFMKAMHIVKKEKPTAILSFGGYIALPIAIAAKLSGIPVYTHEQTIVPGLANKYISLVARTVFLSFPESAMHFNGRNTIVSGNPIRTSVLHPTKEFIQHKKKPVIYVTGGSLGAHAVNVKVEEILHELLEKYIVIHQAGSVKEFNDFKRLSKLQSSLPFELRKNYIVKEHVSDNEIGSIYKSADLVIGRAGANTFFELLALKKPAVFIPLPWSAHDEQLMHARLFETHGAGEVVLQSEDIASLLSKVEKVLADIKGYRSHFDSLSSYNNTHAADTIIDSIFQD